MDVWTTYGSVVLLLVLSGVASIIYTPSVIKAINPYYAVDFLYTTD
jgi:K+ transporter